MASRISLPLIRTVSVSVPNSSIAQAGNSSLSLSATSPIAPDALCPRRASLADDTADLVNSANEIRRYHYQRQQQQDHYERLEYQLASAALWDQNGLERKRGIRCPSSQPARKLPIVKDAGRPRDGSLRRKPDDCAASATISMNGCVESVSA